MLGAIDNPKILKVKSCHFIGFELCVEVQERYPCFCVKKKASTNFLQLVSCTHASPRECNSFFTFHDNF